MKQKYYTLMILIALATNSGAEAQEQLPGEDSQLLAADATNPNPNDSEIIGKSATGEKQTTVVDVNGNLKILDKSAQSPPADQSNNTNTNQSSKTSPGMLQTAPTGVAPVITPKPGSGPNNQPALPNQSVVQPVTPSQVIPNQTITTPPMSNQPTIITNPPAGTIPPLLPNQTLPNPSGMPQTIVPNQPSNLPNGPTNQPLTPGTTNSNTPTGQVNKSY